MTPTGGPASLLRLAPDDDVAIVHDALRSGDVVAVPGDPAPLLCRGDIPAGHKIALRDLAPRTGVRKYGHVIGVTTRAVRAGEHVHVHNLAMPTDPETVASGATDSGGPAGRWRRATSSASSRR